jgi:hypothetical protein
MPDFPVMIVPGGSVTSDSEKEYMNIKEVNDGEVVSEGGLFWLMRISSG